MVHSLLEKIEEAPDDDDDDDEEGDSTPPEADQLGRAVPRPPEADQLGRAVPRPPEADHVARAVPRPPEEDALARAVPRPPEADELAIVPVVSLPVDWMSLARDAPVPELFKVFYCATIGLLAKNDQMFMHNFLTQNMLAT